MSNNPFKPAWWLPNSHLQTIFPAVFRRRVDFPTERERLELPDGDFIDLEWVKAEDPSKPLVLVLHGLEGSIESHYARGMLRAISQLGLRGVFMHFRGCSGEPNRLSRNYHSGDTGDLAYVVRELRNRNPEVPLGAIGFSLGANVLLKWLGETDKENPLRAAIAISVPFELHKAAKRIQRGFSRFYQWYFIKYLRMRMSNKFNKVPVPIDPKIINQVSTIIEFDDKITAPLHGFRGVDDYYMTASSRQYLHNICVPTLILHAKDDPFFSEDSIPETNELSPFVKLEVTETGGHVGFIAGNYPWRPQYWLEMRAPEFLKEFMK